MSLPMSDEKVIYLLVTGEYSDYGVIAAFSSEQAIADWWERLEWRVVERTPHWPGTFLVYAGELGLMANVTSEDAARQYIAARKAAGLAGLRDHRIEDYPLNPSGRVTGVRQ